MNTILGPSFCGISTTSLGKDVEMLVLIWTVKNLRLVCLFVCFKTVLMLRSWPVWDVMQR